MSGLFVLRQVLSIVFISIVSQIDTSLPLVYHLFRIVATSSSAKGR